uniref:SEC23-interacting protein n=1 Tax=Noccaea caerulescens TaxID=107243 RepID=A0A1J3HGK7_NOCCA
MSEGSRRSRVTITLGRSGQVVNRGGSDEFELPRAGTKRSVKERLGNQSDSSFHGSDVVSKRQRGEASFSGNDLQISENDLRFKLMRKNAQKRAQSEECSTMDLRAKLSSSRNEQPPRSLDTRPRMPDPRDVPLPPSRTAHGSSQRLSSSNSHSAWALDDIRQRSPPERYVSTSRGVSPPRNAGSSIRMSRDQSPPRNAGSSIRMSRAHSPPRNAGRIIGDPRDLSPPRHAGRMIGNPRAQSPPRTGRISGNPMDLSPPRDTRSFGGGSRALSPARNVGSSYMGSSRGYSPPMRNPGSSYMGSSRGSPPSSIDDFHGRSRILDDVTQARGSSYIVRGGPHSQAPATGTNFARPMLPPPVPNPHPLPPLSQLPPLGTMMQNRPFPVGEPLTVDSFLESIGLGKYTLAFKREEVDMTTIKQMKESDLKDLIIPMGPRKKILQAIACLPNR